MNDGSTRSVIIPVAGHKCAECVYYPESVPPMCYCAMRNKDVGAKQTACVLGKRREDRIGEVGL